VTLWLIGLYGSCLVVWLCCGALDDDGSCLLVLRSTACPATAGCMCK
jgi:hypothetical protein